MPVRTAAWQNGCKAMQGPVPLILCYASPVTTNGIWKRWRRCAINSLGDGCATYRSCSRPRDRIVNSKDTMLNRREFNGLCLALGSFVTSSGAFALDAATGAASTGAGRTVKFRDGTIVPALGQGSAGLGKGRHPVAEEEEALRTGLSLGMTLIDTAEIYGSEKFIGRVIAGQRDRVFLVSKVWPSHVAGNGIARACEASLARLGTDHLDLYLLHWPNGITDFSHVVRAFEDLHAAGKIRAWGVSNFKVGDMEKLFQIRQGDR